MANNPNIPSGTPGPNPGPPDGPTTAQLIEAIKTLTNTIGRASAGGGGAAGGGSAGPAPGGGGRGAWWNKYLRLSAESWEKSEAATGQPYVQRPGRPVPTAREVKSPHHRNRGRGPFWGWQRKAASFARVKGGAKAGMAAKAGLGAAGKALQMGWPVGMALRSGLAAAAGAAGPFGVALGVATGVAIKFAKAMEDNVRHQVEYARHLAESSAMMRGVVARRDLQERLRDREKGDRLSASAKMLVATEQGNKDAWKETDIAWNKIKNAAGAWWNMEKTWLLMISGLDLKARVFNKLDEWLTGMLGIDKGLTWSEWAQDIAAHDAKARKEHNPEWDSPKFN